MKKIFLCTLLGAFLLSCQAQKKKPVENTEQTTDLTAQLKEYQKKTSEKYKGFAEVYMKYEELVKAGKKTCLLCSRKDGVAFVWTLRIGLHTSE